MSEKKIESGNATPGDVRLGSFMLRVANEMLRRPQEDAERAHRAMEQAYRRGYLHGYSNGMDDVLKASQARRYSALRAWGLVAWFFDGPLTRWLYTDHRGRFEPPPLFSTKTDYRENRE